MNSLVTYASLLALLYFLKKLYLRATNLPLPPGPSGLPFIGNLLDWPTSKVWETFDQWAEIYGNIVHARVLNTHMIVLNSVEVASQLLHEKNTIYSDRPHMPFLGDIVGWGESMVMLDDGPQLREQRRLFLRGIGTKAGLDRFIPMEETKSRVFARQILNEPSSFIQHTRVLAGSIILETTFGYTIKGSGDDVIALAERIQEDFSIACVPGAYMVDMLPWLNLLPSWLPGTGFKKIGADNRSQWMKFVNEPYKYAKDHAILGDNRVSYISSNLHSDITPDQEHSLKWSAANMYSGGSETSATVILTFFYLMATYPNIQAKAQAEIDQAVGPNRLPGYADWDKLPYVKALVSEMFRYGKVAPAGIPHRLRDNDTYAGYFIPKGSIVVTNIHHMSRDPRHYTNPEDFNPDRFIGDNPELDPRSYIFGFGRRICPGRFLGESTVFLAIVTILATMNIEKPLDPNGKEIAPVLEYTTGVVTLPHHFQFRSSARSLQAQQLLQEDVFDDSFV